MRCYNCGSEVPEGMAYCNYCGQPVQQAQYQQPQYQQPQYQQPQYQQPQYQQPYYQPPQNTQPPMGMAWYKFLIYFALFAGAILNLISGISMLNGTYTENAELVYGFFDGWEALDQLTGALMIGAAVLGFVTRFRLSGYCKNGPTLLKLTYVAAAAINLVYVIGINSILSSAMLSQLDFTSFYTSIAVSIAMVAANHVYFDKRSHLFVN